MAEGAAEAAAAAACFSEDDFYCPVCQEVFKTPVRTANCQHVWVFLPAPKPPALFTRLPLTPSGSLPGTPLSPAPQRTDSGAASGVVPRSGTRGTRSLPHDRPGDRGAPAQSWRQGSCAEGRPGLPSPRSPVANEERPARKGASRSEPPLLWSVVPEFYCR